MGPQELAGQDKVLAHGAIATKVQEILLGGVVLLVVQTGVAPPSVVLVRKLDVAGNDVHGVAILIPVQTESQIDQDLVLQGVDKGRTEYRRARIGIFRFQGKKRKAMPPNSKSVSGV